MDNERESGDIVMDELSDEFRNLIDDMRNLKPNDRSEKDRYWAIVLTELEKAQALFEMKVRR